MGFLKEMEEIFILQEVFATEKLDGTNVCKDEFELWHNIGTGELMYYDRESNDFILV
jgi:hypothetical protein